MAPPATIDANADEPPATRVVEPEKDTVQLAHELTFAPAQGGPAADAELPVVQHTAYKVGKEFARGGVGRILVAQDRRLRRPVAIKELLGHRRDAAGRFVREALVTARLQHPSIVPVYEAARWVTGELFYAMKLVSGKSLAELIGEAATVEARLALLPNLIAVADAVAYAHSEGVIHRDLKPANVMVGSFGETIVIDWGLARDLRGGEDEEGRAVESSSGSGEQTVVGTVLGTPAYMAPEQARGEAVGERADVYALGAMLYQLLTGFSPYSGLPSEQAVQRVIAGPPPPIEERARGLPADLVAITHKAMDRDPSQRYPSALELAADLRRFQTGQLVSVVEYSPSTLFLRWLRRHAAAATVAAIATLVLVVLGALGFSRVVEQRNLARRERREAQAAQQLAEKRAGELVLLQARSALDRDPTSSLAWLKQLPPETSVDEVREVAGDAVSRGVARHVVHAHDGLVVGLSFDAGSGWVASGGQNGVIQIIDVASGGARALLGERGLISMAGSPDHRLLAAADIDGAIHLVAPDSGSPPRRLAVTSASAPVLRLEISPDGRRLASGDLEGLVRIHDLAGDAPPLVLRGHSSEIKDLVFTPDGKLLASAGFDGTVRLWNVASGEGRVAIRHGGSVWSLAVSPDGGLLVSASDDKLIGLCNIATGTVRMLAGHRDTLGSLAFAPDGQRFASGGRDGDLRVWSASGEPIASLAGHDGFVMRVLYSPDGKVLASAGADKTVRLWRDGQAPRILRGHEDFVSHLAFSGDGAWLASGGQDGTVRIWSVRDEARRVVSGLHAASGAPGLVAAAGAGGAWLLDAATGEGRPLDGTMPARMLGLSADGRLLAAVGPGGTLTVHDLAGGRVLVSEKLDTEVGGVAATGRWVAVAGYDGSVRVWNVESGARQVWHGHDSYTLVVAFSPDGSKLASAGADRLVQIWDLATGAHRPSPVQSGPVHVIAWSQDSRRIATGDTEGGVHLYDVATFAEIAANHHRSLLRAVAISSDGEAVASGGNDKVVRMTRAGERERVLAGHDQPVTCVAFSPDGRLLASGSFDDTVRVWDVATGAARVVRGHAGDVAQVGFDRAGGMLWSSGSDETLRFTPVAAVTPFPPQPAALRAAIEAVTSARVSGEK